MLPLMIAIIILALAVAWSLMPGREVEEHRKMQGDLLSKMTGLSTPVTNKLAERYADTNADLVADAPTDAAKLIDPAEIFFSYIPQPGNTDLASVFAPMIDHLSKAAGRPVRYLACDDVNDQLRAMRDGRLHVTAFNTGAVPIAVNDAGFVPLATLASGEARSTYKLQILASTRTNVTTPAQLPKPSDKITDYLVFTDPTSNSGYKAPLALLKEQGLTPGFDYASRYSGGHQQSIRGLVAGEYQFIAVASDVLEREIKAGSIKPGDFRVILESDAFPTATFGVAHNLRPELAGKLKDAVMAFGFSGNTVGEYFGASGQTGLKPFDFKTDFEIVREIDDQTGFTHVIPEPVVEPAPTDAPNDAPATAPAE
jgi:phosphonate transport system substrate-binding protein